MHRHLTKVYLFAFNQTSVEGLTLKAVVFMKCGKWELLNLEDMPPRIFSEVMRDLDFVVSVAHAGSIDLESSASSIKARDDQIKDPTILEPVL